MARFLKSAVLLVILAGGVMFSVPAAQASSGGGCGSWLQISGTSGQIISCIGANAPFIDSSGQAVFRSPDSGWSYCVTTINLRDDTNRNTIAKRSYSCTSAAINGSVDILGLPPINGVGGHKYHVYVTLTGTHDGQPIPIFVANSKELTF